jgi:hypothetical protein
MLSQGQALPVTTGKSLHEQGVCVTIGFCSQGQAAFAVLKEHVAIPTAIAAATVSFLIVILTSFYLSKHKDLFCGFLTLCSFNFSIDYVFFENLKHYQKRQSCRGRRVNAF